MNPTTLITISEAQRAEMMAGQKEILDSMKKNFSPPSTTLGLTRFITAKEFMEAVRNNRTKFDQLVRPNKIKIIKKKRKIYLPMEEVDRDFTDRSIL